MTIIFEPLSLEDVIAIVDLQMEEVSSRLGEHGLEIELTHSAKEWLAKHGYDEDFGARPLKRALQRYVESPLSVKLLKGEFEKNDSVLVDTKDEKLHFTHKKDRSKTKSEDVTPVSEVAAG